MNQNETVIHQEARKERKTHGAYHISLPRDYLHNAVAKLPGNLFRFWIPVLFLLCGMFFVGRAIGFVVKQVTASAIVLPASQNWGLGFGASGSQPTGNVSAAELSAYDAYYVGDAKDKVIYLTFDCGYENGNTAPILDALQKHEVSATFFVVGHFLESAPELVKRMAEEGHSVGNHTYHHPDMSTILDRDSFQKELDSVQALYHEITGKEMAMYYRPPQGKFSTDNLTMAKEMGYRTYFWSLAYVDWIVDEQPSHEDALAKLTSRIHPGAIVLLHSTSQTNAEILDELLSTWKEMGYTFGTLDALGT
ncbi:MAG: polysaccharide deacetylase family protein [Lachnospiraceae bacterium]|jgi:peptidoglycan-N-acetylmuramic acid deacetylase|nr:polysaccharide deacetylase family protein [Lachnospiraceae bacterium]